MTLPPPSATVVPRAFTSRLRSLACIGLLSLLAACASQHLPAVQEAAEYRAHARGDYRPPGPPEDPWGPYIVEASNRFDVPDRWVREVMRVESNSTLYHDGELVTSWAGAMGLMQVMPETYDGLRSRYALGDDPYDPHDNILAGAAYIREMYDLYGSPGFLAAYNAGPKRLDEYLTRNRPLPDETRHYVAKIGPYIADFHPVNRSPAEDFAMNQIPIEIPPGPRFGRSTRHGAVQVARASSGYFAGASQIPEPRSPRTTFAELPPLRRKPGTETVHLAALPANSRKGGFRLIQTAMADTLPIHKGGPADGNWAIQVGAFAEEKQAKAAVGSARTDAQGTLGHAKSVVASVQKGHATMYRARITGLSHDAAMQACGRVARRGSCIVLSPEAQS